VAKPKSQSRKAACTDLAVQDKMTYGDSVTPVQGWSEEPMQNNADTAKRRSRCGNQKKRMEKTARRKHTNTLLY
jgi:hypothetical protein